MAIVGISGSLFQCGNTDRLVHSLLGLSLLVQSLKRRGAALPLTGLVIFLLACAWADAGEPSSPAPPARARHPPRRKNRNTSSSGSSPEKAGELAERVGMKGDGKTRLLGFGLPNPTFEFEAQLPGLIRSAFAAARKHDMAVMLHFDFHLVGGTARTSGTGSTRTSRATTRTTSTTSSGTAGTDRRTRRAT